MNSTIVAKKVEIVLLPSSTFEVGNIVQHKESVDNYQVVGKILNETEFKYLNGLCSQWRSLFKPYHLYVLSNEKIEKDDWAYHPEVSEEFTIVNLMNGSQSKDKHPAQGVFKWEPTTNEWYKKSKKIIATTNEELNLPNVPYSFLEKYCINNNCKGLVKINMIIDSTVLCKGKLKATEGRHWKLGRMMECTACGMTDYYNGFEEKEGCRYEIESIKPEISKVNTISINLIKNNWDFEELQKVLHKFHNSPSLDVDEWINDHL